MGLVERVKLSHMLEMRLIDWCFISRFHRAITSFDVMVWIRVHIAQYTESFNGKMKQQQP